MAKGMGLVRLGDGWEGCGKWDGEIGIGLSVGRGVGLTSGESCLGAAADFAGFFLEAD